MKRSGAQLLIEALKAEKVDIVFGFPGGVVIPVFDALYGERELRLVLARHEQGAVHAADGYARSTGRVGVCLVTSGPGATNTVTGLATANFDSVPLVVLTGQVSRNMIGNDAFQEADIVGISRSVTKHNYLVTDRKDLGRITPGSVLHRAQREAGTRARGYPQGRPHRGLLGAASRHRLHPRIQPRLQGTPAADHARRRRPWQRPKSRSSTWGAV